MVDNELNCELRIAMDKMLAGRVGLGGGMRGLRRAVLRCRSCPLGNGCPHLAEHRRLVDRAIEAASAGLRLP